VYCKEEKVPGAGALRALRNDGCMKKEIPLIEPDELMDTSAGLARGKAKRLIDDFFTSISAMLVGAIAIQ